MKTVDVITVVVNNASIPETVHLFPILDESKRNEIVEKAEDLFISIADELELGIEEEEIEEALDSGYYECQQSYDSVSIVWSKIEI